MLNSSYQRLRRVDSISRIYSSFDLAITLQLDQLKTRINKIPHRVSNKNSLYSRYLLLFYNARTKMPQWGSLKRNTLYVYIFKQCLDSTRSIVLKKTWKINTTDSSFCIERLVYSWNKMYVFCLLLDFSAIHRSPIRIQKIELLLYADWLITEELSER